MIYLPVSTRGAHTFKDYLQDWAGELKPTLKVFPYEAFLRWPVPNNGTFIFTDIERLTDEQLALARDYAAHLQRQSPDVRILNHPQRAMCRLALLNTLKAQGMNTFRAFPILAMPNDIRFPVFLRREREHQGPASELLPDMKSLRGAALKLAISGVRMDEILVVEYCETRSPDGWYRKYSAFRIGDRILPAHIIFSKHWIAKDGASESDALMAEEAAYMQDHPHASWLKQVFDWARIDYGRIDYSMLDGRPQVWEINTNPTLLKSRAVYEETAPKELHVKEKLAVVLQDCFRSLDVGTASPRVSPPREINFPRFGSLLDTHQSSSS